ncbi:CE1759 family FMN reductase [Kocuria turfanensis]|uniref:CE1759 family FMN reductase n=1 Tax=Kocuria turfanensis TaxID=388357 RepID=UPI004035D41F
MSTHTPPRAAPTPGAARPVRLVVVSAGMSEASSTRLLADRLTEATRDALGPAPVRITRVDLRPLAHAITDHLLTGFPAPDLGEALEAVSGADALIAATPTFKASYAGLFKSFFDLVEEDALEGLPVLVAATGGTARHSLMLDTALRPLFAYLKAFVLPLGVYAATEDWAGEELQARIRRAGAHLAAQLAPGRAPDAPAAGETPAGAAVPPRGDVFADVPDFADLLARAGQ